MSETKKRLLLSKWRCCLEKAMDKIDELQEQIDNHDAEVADMIEVLEQVKYWMHEPLCLQMPMRDPRVILRKVEDALS